jgi:hypothetical protein
MRRQNLVDLGTRRTRIEILEHEEHGERLKNTKEPEFLPLSRRPQQYIAFFVFSVLFVFQDVI